MWSFIDEMWWLRWRKIDQIMSFFYLAHIVVLDEI